MPLIRYRMGDVAARVPEVCECGRGLGLLTRVQGRTAHMIRRPDGGLITTPNMTSAFGRAGGNEWVRRFQVREAPGNVLRLLVEVRAEPTPAQRDALLQTVRLTVGPTYDIAIELLDHIPSAPNGKLQFLVPLPREERRAV